MSARETTAAAIPALPGENELPCSDGEPMETEIHRDQMLMLIEILRLYFAARDDVYVGGNQFLYFSSKQIKSNDFRGPDVFVVLDTVRRIRKSWVVWEEDGRTPDLVIEITSDSTRAIDRGEKMVIYARKLHVPCYVIYDPDTQMLEAFELHNGSGAYRRLHEDAEGVVDCPPLGLKLGVRHTRWGLIDGPLLRFLHPDGRLLPTSPEYLVGDVSTTVLREADHVLRLERGR